MEKEISKRHRFQNTDNSISANGGNGKQLSVIEDYMITIII